MHCATCGQPVRDGRRFCGSCGSPLPGVDAGTTVALAPDHSVLAATYALIIRLPGAPEQVVPLAAATLRIGSAPGCDVQITDPTFTGLDLAVVAHKGSYLLRDRHMARGLITAGVKVNEAVLGVSEPVYAPTAQGKALSVLLRPLAHGSALGRRDGAMQALTIRFRPDQDTLTLGRDLGNDVVVDYPLVSRFHAQIERLDHHVLLHDLRSTNGSFVDGQRVKGLHELQVGNEIQIGPVRFVFRGNALEEVDDQPRVRIDAVDLVRRAGRRGGKVLPRLYPNDR